MKITVIIPITSSSVNSISITVSLRLGHAAGLTVPRTVIQYRVAATLPLGKAKRNSVFPIKGSNRHRVMVFSEYPKILMILYHSLKQ